MAITKANSSSGRNTTGSTTPSLPLGFTPTAGNVLILYLAGSSGTASRTATVSGWTKVGENYQPSGAAGGYGGIFIKIATGSETTADVTFTLSTIPAWIIEEWPGTPGGATNKIDTNFFPDAPTPVLALPAFTTGSGGATMSSNTLTTETGDWLILTGYMGRGTTTQPAPTWGGGASASTSGSTGSSAFCYSAAQENTSGTGTSVTHTATGTNGQGGPAELLGSVGFRVGSSTITVNLGVATETDSAPSAARIKTRKPGVASETDTAPAVTRVKTRKPGVATETDTALAVSRSKVKSLGVATETDSAPHATTPTVIRVNVGVASETDTAPALAKVTKTVTLGVATETDTAPSLSRAKQVSLGVATEADTAAAVSRLKARLLGCATETDTAPHPSTVTSMARIDDTSSKTLTALQSITVQSDGVQWWIVGHIG